MDKKTRAIIGVVLTMTVWPVVFYIATRPSQHERISSHGADAEGTVVSLVDQHETRHDHRPLMELTVEGEWGGAHHRTRTERRIDDDELESFHVGDRVAIRYDRESPSDIAVLHVIAPSATP